ncbi:MAG: hypothetical protein LBC90_08975 [Candidatus Adiutrix sp.]|jgi:hypothetical protein|nr:hypothetical protein [Candidatus Adiutrix sp.]
MATETTIVSTTVTKAEVEAVKAGLCLLVVTIKNCALYPPNNKIRQESLAKLQAWMADFLKDNEVLRLFVEWEGLRYRGQMVYQEKTGEQALMFPLYRDGVQWIEFQDEITQLELEQFIDFLNRFRIVREEAEDDLVTALWEAELPNILYKTASEFLEINPQTEVAALEVWKARKGEAEKAEAVVQSDFKSRDSTGGAGDLKSLAALTSLFAVEDLGLPPAVPAEAGKGGWNVPQAASLNLISSETEGLPDWLFLSEEEKKSLQNLAAWEEKEDDLPVVLDMLLILMLGTPVEADKEEELLNFMAEKAGQAMASGYFTPLRFFAQSLRYLAKASEPRLVSLLAAFVGRLSSPEVLEPLASLWPQERVGPEILAEFNQILVFLPPEAAMVTAAVCGKTKNGDLQHLLLGLLARLLPRAASNLVPMVRTVFKPPLILSLLDLLRRQDEEGGDLPVMFLAGLSRHMAPEVRIKAAELLLDRQPGQLRHLTHMVADLEPSVNRFICERLGRRRADQAEKPLLDHLGEIYRQSTALPRTALFNYYRALGRCASAQALGFLKEALLRKDLKSIFGLSEDAHRVGAALALMMMPEDLSGPVLRKAESSSIRSVRQAWLMAKVELNRGYYY